jgi:hypothetical protein
MFISSFTRQIAFWRCSLSDTSIWGIAKKMSQSTITEKPYEDNEVKLDSHKLQRLMKLGFSTLRLTTERNHEYNLLKNFLITHPIPDSHEVFIHPEAELTVPVTRELILSRAPSLRILEQLRASHIRLDDLHWRQFEELVADLLSQEGYEVTLGPGRKDGGKDIIATKHIPGSGFFMAVWQARKLAPHNKVGLSAIRELADTRQEHKASKGVIATTTSLTHGALARIERDCYLLHKVDGNDLDAWIRSGQRP